MKSILTIFLIFFSVAFAGLDEISTVTDDGVELKGVHLPNKGGEPVLLIHGFMENTRFWREAAYLLYNQGFDVYLFNMRGHGNGDQKSVPLEGVNTRMGFDEIVSHDIPAMIDYVYKSVGRRKINLIGHSMGTMSSRLTMSGVTKKDGNMIISDEMKKWARTRVKGVIAFASPSNFAKSDFKLKSFFRLGPDALLEVKRYLLTKIFKQKEAVRDRAPRGIFAFTAKLRSMYTDGLLRFGLTPYLLRSVIDVDNLSKDELELARLVDKGISIPHQDLFNDADRWIQSNVYGSRDGNVLYKNLAIPTKLPYVFVGAGKDRLAHPDEIIDDYLSQGNRKNMTYIHLQDFSHMDAVTGLKGGEVTSNIIAHFVDNRFSMDGVDVLNSDYAKVHTYSTDGGKSEDPDKLTCERILFQLAQ